MKILIDARPLADPHSGGVRRVGIGLVETVCKTAVNDEITLLTTGAHKKTIPFDLPPNTRQLHVKIPNKLLSTSMILGISLESFLPEEFDFMLFPNLGFTGPLNTSYAVLLHDLSFLIEPKWFSRKDRLWHKAIHPKQMIEQAEMVFAVSEKTKHDLKRLLGREKDVKVISVAYRELKSIDTYQNEKSYFFAFGSHDPRKNSACIIEAMRELVKTHDAELLMTGNAPCNEPFVKTIGRPDDETLAAYIKGAKALLYPSWYEGFGLPVHEAATLGTPVLASIAGALPETVPLGTKLIQPEKPHLWQSAMKAVLASEKSSAPISEAQSWESAAQDVLQTIKERHG